MRVQFLFKSEKKTDEGQLKTDEGGTRESILFFLASAVLEKKTSRLFLKLKFLVLFLKSNI